MSVETAEAPAAPATVSPAASLWRTLLRLDRAKMNAPSLALRNALAVGIPLGVGIALNYPPAGAAVATGALNVAYSDGIDPYAHRARRMLTWSLLGALAAYSGSACGPYHVASILLTAAWAFVAGLLVSISTRAGDLGLNTLVAVIVFGARGPSSAGGALDAGLLVLLGGLLQTATSLLFWPVHRYEPERRAIAHAFAELAEALQSQDEEGLAEPLGKSPSTQEQDTIAALGRDRSIEGERLRLIFDQADRIRLSANLVRRLQSQSAYHGMTQTGALAQSQDDLVTLSDEVLSNGAKLLQQAQASLIASVASPELKGLAIRASELAGQVRHCEGSGMLANELCSAVDALSGQLRVVAGLVSRSTHIGAAQFRHSEEAQPWRLQMQGWLATLLSNMSLQSAAFRHGVRTAVFVVLGELLSRGINWQRSYWIPMTVAVILKPDFNTTFSRGLLRVGGTIFGVLLATALYHVLPAQAAPELLLVGVFTFVLRRYGPSNYGIFTVAITGLIVFLMAATGIAPAEVVVQRGINTIAGGCLALVAYAIWPTWERRVVSDVVAEMLDAMRLYFQAVEQEFEDERQRKADAARNARQVWRRARSSAEASVDRVSSEPKISAERVSLLQSMLASSHAVVHAVMGLEAGLQSSAEVSGNASAAEMFRTYSHDVEFTLYFLAAAMRGSTHAREGLPSLREDHRRLVEAYGVKTPEQLFLLAETDRLTVALNTLREQVLRFAI